MKKMIAIALAAIMLLALAACSTSTVTTETETETPAAAETETSAAATEESNVLIMATNAFFPPYEYYENEKVVGIDAEIAEAVAAKLGKTLQIEDMEFGSIIAAIQSGKVDIGMAGMTVTEERLQSVNFSNSYSTGIQSVIVAEGSSITTLDDLYAEGATYVVGVQQDTTGDIYSTDDFGEDRVERYATGAEAVQALITGKLDCVIIDNEPAKNFVAANSGLVILDTEYAVEDYAIAIAKDNDQLLADVNAALEELTADGTIASIVAKYIPAE